MISHRVLLISTVCLAVSAIAAIATGASVGSADDLPPCTAPFSLPENSYVETAFEEEGTPLTLREEVCPLSASEECTLISFHEEELSVSVVMESWIYDGAPRLPTVTVKSPSAYSVEFEYERTDKAGYVSAAAPIAAGEYRLTVTVTLLAERRVERVTEVFSVLKRPLTLSAGADCIYDGYDHSRNFSLSGFVPGEEVGQDAVIVSGEARLAGEYRYAKSSGAGRLAVSLEKKEGTFDPANYRLQISESDGQFCVKKATATIGGTFVRNSVPYRGSIFEESYFIGENGETAPALSKSDTVIDLTVSYDNGGAVKTTFTMEVKTSSKNAGTYSLDGERTLLVELTPADADNFTAVIDEEEAHFLFLVFPRQLLLEAGDDLVYDGEDHSDHFRLSGFLAGEEPQDMAIVDIRGIARNAGTYRFAVYPEKENDIIVSLKEEVQGAFDPQNYEIVPVAGGRFTIEKRPFTLALESVSLHYTGKGIGARLSVTGVKGERFEVGDYTLSYSANGQRSVFEEGTGLPLLPGRYTVTATPVAGGAAEQNYCAGSAEFEILASDMAVLCTMESRTYDGTPPVPKITVNGGEPFEGLSVTFSYTDAGGNKLIAPPVDAGSYRVSATVIDEEGRFHPCNTDPVPFVIYPRELVLVAGEDKLYDLTDHGRNFTVTGFLAGEEVGDEAVSVRGAAKNAGEYRYTAGGGEGNLLAALVTEDIFSGGKRFHPANYKLSVDAELGAFRILPAETEAVFPQFSEGGFTVAYNGTDRYLELCAVRVVGVAGEEVAHSVRVLRGETACAEAKDAAVYTVTVEVSDSNYVLKGEEAQTFEIRRAVLLVSGVSVKDKRYDGTDAAEVTQGDLAFADATGEEVRYALEARFVQTDASKEPIRVDVTVSYLLANGKDGRGNYLLLFEAEGERAEELSVWAHIEAANISLSGTRSKIYTGEDLYRAFAEEIVPVNFNNATLLPRLEVEKQPMKDAGSYALGVRIAAADRQNFTFEEGERTVFTAQIEAAEIVGIVWRVGGAEAEERYPYLGAEGYTLMAEGTWYPANDRANDPKTQKLSLLSDGAPSNGVFSRYREEGYLFTAVAQSENFTLAPALTLRRKLFVAKRELTVSAEQLAAEGKVYDGTTAAQVRCLGVEGVAAGDDLFVNAHGVFESARTGENRVDVSLSLAGRDAGNYELSNAEFTLTAGIAKRKLTLFGLSVLPKKYDGERTASLAYAGTDALPGDDVRVGFDARFLAKDVGVEEPVRIAAIRLLGEDADCYTAEYLLGESLMGKIEPAELRVIPQSATDRVYDGSDLVEVRVRLEESGIVAGDDVFLRSELALGRARSAEAGRREVVLEGTVALAGRSAGNYVAVLAQEPLSVNILRAEIVVCCFVSETSIVYGDSAPVLAITYSGFVNGEKEDVIVPAVYAADYDQTDPAKRGRGRYRYSRIREASAANYTFVYMEEELSFTVEARPLAVEWGALALSYNGRVQTPSATVAGTVYGEETPLIVEGGQRSVGVYRATAFLGVGSENYYLENGDAEFAIVKATPVVTAEELNFVYDGAAHGLFPHVPEWVREMSITYNGKEELPVEAGEYEAAVVVPESADYHGVRVVFPLKIEQKSVFAQWSEEKFTADGKEHTPFLGLSGGAEANVVYSTVDGVVLSGTPTAPGTYRAVVRPADENNYRLEGESERTFVIEAKRSAVRWVFPAFVFFVLAPVCVVWTKRRKRR